MGKYKSKLLNHVQAKPKKKAVNLYIEAELYVQFKRILGKLTPSQVIEEFIRDIVGKEKGK